MMLQVWYEYGTFCLRTGKQGQAEQCLREAVAIEPSHKLALMALAALLWHIGLHTDSAHLDQAETVVHAAKEISPEDPAVWALLTLVYASMAARRVSEHRNAASEMRRLAKLKTRKLAGNPYLQVLMHDIFAMCRLFLLVAVLLHACLLPLSMNPMLGTIQVICRSSLTEFLCQSDLCSALMICSHASSRACALKCQSKTKTSCWHAMQGTVPTTIKSCNSSCSFVCYAVRIRYPSGG